MIIYADILVIVNVLVDYFLLLAAARLLRQNPKPIRLLLGSMIGGFGSFIIFLPPIPLLAEVLVRIALCGLISMATFGYHSFRRWLRSLCFVLLVTFGYGGAMTALWYLFRPGGMAIIRSVVYFDISPLLLVVATLFFYLLFTVASYLLHRKGVTAKNCLVTVEAGDKIITVKGMLDTGNSLEDLIGGGEVLIGDQACMTALFGETPRQSGKWENRYRLIPCGTVSGGGMLEAYRLDSATVSTKQESVTLRMPLLALSKVPIGDDVSVIVNPEIFTS